MAKKNKAPPPSPPASSSSSGEDSSSPPSNSPVKKPSANFTVDAMRKHAVPSSESIDREKWRKDEESTDDDSFDDSGAVVVRSNPPLLIRETRNAGKQPANTSSSDLGSDDGEEDEDEDDSSSKSEQQQQQELPPPPQKAGSTVRNNPAALISGSDSDSEDELENSSDFNMSAPPPRIADPSLMPFSSKPMDGHPPPADKNTVSAKRLAAPSAQISEKKRKTADIVGADGGPAKKEISRRIWSKADELSLLQCILDYKENHRVIPSTQDQFKSLLKALNDSLSASVTLSQMNAKIRVLKKKRDNAAKLAKGGKNQNVSDAHSAAVFDRLTKIWGSNKDSYFLENEIKPEIVKSVMQIEGKVRPFAAKFPFLHCHLKSEHPNIALVFESHMPIAKVNEFEGNCKKLEREEIQLHMQKAKLLPSALKLIESTLVE